jgi:hypothetical protein
MRRSGAQSVGAPTRATPQVDWLPYEASLLQRVQRFQVDWLSKKLQPRNGRDASKYLFLSNFISSHRAMVTAVTRTSIPAGRS